MYEYLDRDITGLDIGARFLIRAIRNWRIAVENRGCPAAEVVSAFERHGVMDALPHFHLAMMILRRHGVQRLDFGDPASTMAHEGEALVIALVADMNRVTPVQARATVVLLVDRQWVGSLHVALAALAGRMSDAGFAPQRQLGLALPSADGA